MEQQRLQELERKRFEGGLSDEEADELGRLIAEREGKPYSNADMRETEDVGAEGEIKAWEDVPKDAAEAKERQAEDVESPYVSERAGGTAGAAEGDEPEEVGGKRSPRPGGASATGAPPPAESDEEYKGPGREDPGRSEPPSTE